MATPVVYRRKVGRDLAGAYGWYEVQRHGLGEEFLTAVDATFDAVEQLPEMFARVHGEVRRANVSRFSISSSRESSGAAAATFLSTHKTTVNMRGDQNLDVLGFAYRLVRA